jgi:hypothetical protein
MFTVAAAPGTYETRATGSIWINTTSGTVSPRMYAATGTGVDLNYRQIHDGAVHQYSLNETSGTTIIDAGSSPANGTYVGGGTTLAQTSLTARTGSPYYSTLIQSGYASFGFTDLPGTPGTNNPWSFEFLYKSYSGSNLGLAGNGNVYIYNQGISLDTGLLRVGFSGGTITLSCPQWPNQVSPVLKSYFLYHIVVTYDGSVVRYYLNNSLVSYGNSSGTYVGGTTNFTLGAPYASGSTTPGYYQNAAFYSTVLTATQIAAHYAFIYQQESLFNPLN